MKDVISLTPYSVAYKSVWDDAVKRSKNFHFFFLRDYIEYHGSRFEDCSLLIAMNDKVVGVLPGHLVDDRFCSHQGLTFGGLVVSDKVRAKNCSEILGRIITYMKDIEVTSLLYKKGPCIYNQLPFEEDSYHLINKGARLVSSELIQVIDYANYKYSSVRRNEISKAKKHSIEVSSTTSFRMFWELLKQNLMNKHGVQPTHTWEEIERLAELFPSNIRLYCAKRKGRLLCGTVLYINPTTVHTQYIASSKEARECCALEYLLNEVISKYKDRRYFSFGTSTEAAGTVLNSGLAFFKEAFGARGVLQNTYELSIN